MTNILGKRIRTLRTEKEMTQTDLASVLNIRNTTLSQYENGINTPSDEIKLKLADYFSCSVDYLLGRTNNRDTKPLSKHIHPLERNNLSDDDIKKIEEYADLLRLKHNQNK